MASKRIKYAMGHLSHKKYIALLARPNWRHLERIDANRIICPFAVHRAALKSRASKRLKIMAQPRTIAKKFDPTIASSTYVRIHPKTLNAKASKRIVDLALPKKNLAMATKKFVVGNKTMTITLNNLLMRIRRSRYQRYRILCNAIEQQAATREAKRWKRMHKALSKPEDWERHKRVLEKIAEPKVIPQPEEIDRGERISLKDMKRLDFLSTPVIKEFPDARDPFKVAPGALTYQISDRIREIAFRKNPPELVAPRMPWEVSPAAIKAVASPRIEVLAKPAVRPAGLETDLKEDAFKVSPKALKARCSPRIKNLAKPKTYGKS